MACVSLTHGFEIRVRSKLILRKYNDHGSRVTESVGFLGVEFGIFNLYGGGMDG